MKNIKIKTFLFKTFVNLGDQILLENETKSNFSY